MKINNLTLANKSIQECTLNIPRLFEAVKRGQILSWIDGNWVFNRSVAKGQRLTITPNEVIVYENKSTINTWIHSGLLKDHPMY